MMKGRDDSTGSFDLFLDTICNTFGGIVFLAILLAILIQTRAIVKTPQQESEESPLTAEQVRELIAELDMARSDYSAIAAAFASLPPLTTSEDDADYRKLDAERKAIEGQVSNAMQKQTRQTQLLARQLAENVEINEENAAVPRELQDIESKVHERSASLKSLVTSRQTTLKIPRDRATNAPSVLGLLQGSRFYLAKLPSYSSRSFNDDHVSTQASGRGINIKPRSGRGWSLNDRELTTMIQNAHSRRHIVTVAVWPDSYDDFSTVKEALVKSGVMYQLWPQQQDEVLTVYFGAGHNRVQ
jgi:hypothetical protein